MIIIKYQTNLTKGEKTFTGEKAMDRCMVFVRMLAKRHEKTKEIEWDTYIKQAYSDKLNKEERDPFIPNSFLKVEFITNGTNQL